MVWTKAPIYSYTILKVTKIPRYDMKCSGKTKCYTVYEKFHVVSRLQTFSRYISCYNNEFCTIWDSVFYTISGRGKFCLIEIVITAGPVRGPHALLEKKFLDFAAREFEIADFSA